MPRRISIEPHLSIEELENRYRQSKDAIARTHYQIIWLLALGKTTAEVASITGYGLSWIYELVRSYNRYGAKMLGDRRQNNTGAEPLLDDVQLAQLWQILQSKPADGGLWNGPKVAAWMSELLGRKVSPQRGWEYLRGLKMRPLVPRPHHEETSWEEQEAWKKKLTLETQKIQTEHPDANVEVWTMDEHRLGLKPVLRKVWAPSGEQPIAPVNWRYQWLWLYGFVHPESGETYWWILPYVRTDIFNLVLADFAKHFEVGKNKQIVLAMDQAGWHTSRELEVPQGIHIILMPSHSPELQPAERLWPVTNQAIANESFDSLDHLEEALFQRCKVISDDHDLIRGLTYYHWWPQTNRSFTTCI
jgi:transposase